MAQSLSEREETGLGSKSSINQKNSASHQAWSFVSKLARATLASNALPSSISGRIVEELIMELKPYKQSLTHSCLVAAFLMLLENSGDIKFTEKEEQEIALLGSRRVYPFYVVGVTVEIAQRYKSKIKVFADNKYFADILSKSFTKEKNISVEAKPVTLKLIRELLESQPVICHVDVHGLGDYSHASHFIVIEKGGKETFTIIDPWIGKRKRVSAKTLENTIFELKNHVKMCPLLFAIN